VRLPLPGINQYQADRTGGEKLVCRRIEVRKILHLIRCMMQWYSYIFHLSEPLHYAEGGLAKAVQVLQPFFAADWEEGRTPTGSGHSTH